MTIWQPWHECPENQIEGSNQRRWVQLSETKRQCPACKKVFNFDTIKQDWVEENNKNNKNNTVGQTPPPTAAKPQPLAPAKPSQPVSKK